MSMFADDRDEARLVSAMVRAANAFADYYEQKAENLKKYEVASLEHAESQDNRPECFPVAEPDPKLANPIQLGIKRAR